MSTRWTEAKDPFDLLDELEEELIINVRPLTWPIESGPRFKGVYNLYEHKLNLFQPSKQVVTEKVEVDINTEELDNQIGAPLAEKLRGELELVDGVYPEFNVEEYLKGEMAPVFFGLGAISTNVSSSSCTPKLFYADPKNTGAISPFRYSSTLNSG